MKRTFMYSMAPSRLHVLVLLAAFAVSWAGCGPKKSEVGVSGKVSVEGQPVDTGSITFTPADGKTHVSGGVIENGTYKAAVPLGKKIVQVRGLKKAGQREVLDEVTGKKYTTEMTVRMTPVEYEAADSPLTADVTKDGEVFDFDLKKEYKK